MQTQGDPAYCLGSFTACYTACGPITCSPCPRNPDMHRLDMASFVTTWMDPEAEALIAETQAVNIVDTSQYPQCTEMEHRWVALSTPLYNAVNFHLHQCTAPYKLRPSPCAAYCACVTSPECRAIILCMPSEGVSSYMHCLQHCCNSDCFHQHVLWQIFAFVMMPCLHHLLVLSRVQQRTSYNLRVFTTKGCTLW